MPNIIRSFPESPANKGILAFIDNLSAHSDVGAVLLKAVESPGNVHLFSPDWSSCRYVVASTRWLVFACAFGMNVIGFRLGDELKSRALMTGAETLADAGERWVRFTMFLNDWPEFVLIFWARMAYYFAREG